MSKIGRKPIDLKGVKVELKDNKVFYSGAKVTGVHELPSALSAELVDGKVKLIVVQKSPENNMLWGLHRALLANEIEGAGAGFSQKVVITGLGFKGILNNNKIDFSLGYSHKIHFPIPDGITIEIDKTGQMITVKGYNKELVGHVCSKIKALRPTEPYKGTGIKLEKEVILRKAGKTKSA
jgi:large subunit ribosomal protein L6